MSRNTVKKYLREAGPPQFKARKYVKELDNYQEEIEDMLAKGFIGTRIFNELTDMGYKGSLSSVHRYLRAIKEDDKITKLATTRVETCLLYTSRHCLLLSRVVFFMIYAKKRCV